MKNSNKGINNVSTRKNVFSGNHGGSGGFNTPRRKEGLEPSPRYSAPVQQTPVQEEYIKHTIPIDDRFEEAVIAGWRIRRNHKDRIIVAPIDKNDVNRRFRTYGFEPGVIHITEYKNPEIPTKLFFRTTKFQNFLDKYRISKVQNSDPNGEYRGVKNDEYDAYVITNGSMAQSSQSSDVPVILDDKRANVFFTVKDASFALFDSVKQDRDGTILRRHRILVTKNNVLNFENDIAGILDDKMADPEDVKN